MKTPAIPLSTPMAFCPQIALVAGLILFFALVRPLPVIAAAQADTQAGTQVHNQVDNRIYATLLDQHVRKNRVDYDGFKRDEALLDRYLAILSSIDSAQLFPRERLAFFINAYNAFTIKLILTKYPGINSIKEIGSFFSNPWSQKFISLNGHTVSLDYIEHEVLRPKFKDPRIHFAINCAAKSCPPLFNQPFDGKRLDAQLDERTSKFVNDASAVYLKENTLYTSKIFKWFSQDFNDAPLIFIKTYATGEFKDKLTAGSNIKISYLPYDWTLNRR
jgi:Protein of unknown function, DUF547